MADTTETARHACLEALTTAGLQTDFAVLPVPGTRGYYEGSQFQGTPVITVDPGDEPLDAENTIFAGLGEMIWEQAERHNPELLDFLLEIGDEAFSSIDQTPREAFIQSFRGVCRGYADGSRLSNMVYKAAIASGRFRTTDQDLSAWIGRQPGD